MTKIITISREFGSGGRELGTRIAKQLGFAYYDKEIISQIAQKSGLAEEYVDSVLERKNTQFFNFSYAHSFAYVNPLVELQSKIYGAQQDIIREIAQKSDCVLVGRCADYILKDLNPLTLFVYADIDSKIKRCREKAQNDEQEYTDKQLKAKILSIDKGRAKYYGAYTGEEWSDKKNYRLCINTSGINISDIVPSLCKFAEVWFAEKAEQNSATEKNADK